MNIRLHLVLGRGVIVPLVLLLSAQTFAGVFDNHSAPRQTRVFSDSSSSGQSVGARYATLEEARFALRNALLDYSKECKTTGRWLNSARWDKRYNEVVGYIVRHPDGTYGLSRLTMGGESSVAAPMPSGAVESMHTHPWFVEYDSGAWTPYNNQASYPALGPSGADAQAARDQGIPAFVLDCASGDVYGVGSDGKALKMACDENAATCTVDSMKGKDEHVVWDWSPLLAIIEREYSQQALDAQIPYRPRQEQDADRKRRSGDSASVLQGGGGSEATAQGGTAKRTIDIPSFSDIFGGACGPCVAGDLMGTCTTEGCPNYGRPHREYKWQ